MMTQKAKTFLAAIIVLTIAAGALRAGESGPVDGAAARKIALEHTGGGEVVEFEKKEYGPLPYYRLEVVNGGKRFHIEVDAATGGLLKFIRQRRGRAQTAATATQAISPQAGGSAGTNLTHEQAIAKALNLTGGGTVVDSEMKWKKGAMLYDIEIMNNHVKYDVVLDAASGSVVGYKQKAKGMLGASAGAIQSPNLRMTAEAAQMEALRQAGGGTVTEYELDTDDGGLVHEVTVIQDNLRYEIEIEDATGTVREFSVK